MCIRILDKDTLKVSIRYALDTEHGLEFKFAGGQVAAIGHFRYLKHGPIK